MSLLRAALLLAVLAGLGGIAPTQAGRDDPGVVALIIDDLGYDQALARRVLALPRPFGVAVLPDSPLARMVRDSADRRDIDVMLHLPMSGSRNGAEPGRGVVTAGMSADAVRRVVRDGLAAVPEAVAVNNHEGSGITADAEPMATVMAELAAHDDIAFVDSRTHPRTVAATAARAAGLPAASRDVFLDHDPDPEAIERAFDQWLTLAKREGCALAIAHPRPSTLAVLERRLPELGDEVDRVGIRTYIERCGTNG